MSLPKIDYCMDAHLKYKANYFNQFQGTNISEVWTVIKINLLV